MASKAFIQNPNLIHVPILGDKTSLQTSQSFGRISLPMNTTSISSFSKLSSSSSLMASSSINNTPSTSHDMPLCLDSKAPLSRVWREIQGCNCWENLIEPLNTLLKQEITRYGNLVVACYKAFDLDPKSKRYLNCKYGKQTLLKQAGIVNADDYHVTKYIYAVPDNFINFNINIKSDDTNRGRWIGYVAVSSDELMERLGRRDIVVTFRGTVTNQEWLANFMSSLTPARLDPHDQRQDVKVESGLLSLYTSDENQSKFGLESCRQQLLSEISRLINQYKDEEMSITLAGHSMGSSLAHLLAYDISELGINRRVVSPAAAGDYYKNDINVIPVTVFSFAGPRVGNLGFKERCEELGVKVLRIANVNDPITKLPGVVFNENFSVLGGKYELPWSCSCYAHVGVELALDFFNVQNPTCVHDLETYINLLNRPKTSVRSQSQSHSDQEDANLTLDYFNRTNQMMTLSKKSLKWEIAAYNVVNLLGSVSHHLLHCNIF